MDSTAPFAPFFRNAHLSTLASNFWKRPVSEIEFPPVRRIYRTAPDVEVAVDEQIPRGKKAVGHVLAIHGLEGSSESGYIRSLSHELLGAGYAMHRFNMRSCGGTEHLASSNYHAGQTSDALAVLKQIRSERDAPLFLIGYSLGGNVSLKLAGELGAEAAGLLDGVCSISTPIDLSACSDALERKDNFIYQNRFLKYLKARIRRRHLQYPDQYSLEAIDRVRSIRQFDDAYTAQLFNFGSASNYFATQSSNQFLEFIRIPTLMIQSKDDPMIPFGVYDHPGLKANPEIRLIATDRGGHVGFIARSQPRFWVDGVIREWIDGIERNSDVRNKRPGSSVIIG